MRRFSFDFKGHVEITQEYPKRMEVNIATNQNISIFIERASPIFDTTPLFTKKNREIFLLFYVLGLEFKEHQRTARQSA